MLSPCLAALPLPQQRLWEELSSVPRDFVLYGGTAIALRLGHRQSKDFDFFSSKPFQPDDLERRVPFLVGVERLQAAPNTLTSLVDRDGAVKVSFFGGLTLRRVRDPEPAEGPGFLVASLLDLAATKVKVVQDRAEAKDYVDLGRLLEEGVSLDDAMGAAVAVYGPDFNALISLKALSYFADGDLPTLPAAVRERLTRAVALVDPLRLPQSAPLAGGLAP
jgi:hypothetical protein